MTESEIGAFEDFGKFALREVAVYFTNGPDVVRTDFVPFVSEALPHLPEKRAGVDELDFVLPFRFLSVGKHPNVGGYPRIVEKLVRKRNDGFEIVVFAHPTTYLAFTASGVPRKKRGAIEYHADAGSALARVTHFGNHVFQKQELPVRTPWQTRAETSSETPFRFLFHGFLVLLPIHAIGRVGEDVIEFQVRKLVGRQGTRYGVVLIPAPNPVRVLALHEHVRLADGVSHGVELLTVCENARLVVEAGEHVVFSRRKHAAGSAAGVVNRFDDVRSFQDFRIGIEQRLHDELDDFAGSIVFSSRLVGLFGKPADEFFEDVSHLVVGDRARMEVDLVEFLDYQVQHVPSLHSGELFLELEFLEYLLHVVRKARDVVAEVLRDIPLVVEKFVKIIRRDVVEPGSGHVFQNHADIGDLSVVLVKCGEHLGLGVREDAVEALQKRERQDDVLVFVLFPTPAKQFGDIPNKARFRGGTSVRSRRVFVFWCHRVESGGYAVQNSADYIRLAV